MSNDGFYSKHEWHKLRSKAMAKWRAAGLPCHWCNQPLDWRTKGAVVADHVLNRRLHPHLALEITNIAAVCHPCNTKKYHYQEANTREQVGIDGLPGSWR